VRAEAAVKVREPYRCDYCQKPKGESNHWWLRDTMVGLFVLSRWDEAEAAGDGREHICSESCAAKALSKWMGVSNPVLPEQR